LQLHDYHYRNLFRHPAMVRALFEGIIVEPWVTALDLDSLRPLPTHYLSDKHRRREADMVWRVKWRAPSAGLTGTASAGLAWQAVAPDAGQAEQEAYLVLMLEHSPDIAQTQGLLHTLQKMLSAPQADELRRAFGAWVRHILMPRAAPKDAKLPDTTEFSEVVDMLTTGYKNWSRRWWLEGREEGLEEGREQGACALLLRQLDRKFGPLDALVKARVEQASLAEREAWSLNLLDARSLDEVFATDAGDADA